MCSRSFQVPVFFFILLFSSYIHAEFYSDLPSASIGDKVTLTWSSSASTCIASDSWSGPKPGSGTEEVTLPAEGWNGFALYCYDGYRDYVWVWGNPAEESSSNSANSSNVGTSSTNSQSSSGYSNSSNFSLTTGFNHSCVLDDNGVKCWGGNDEGQTNVPALSNPTQVSAGGARTCAIDDNGVQCWGKYVGGQPTLSNPTQVSTSLDHTCAIDDNGLQCWGDNSKGQTDVPSLSNPIQVSTASFLTCALDDSGVQCWGNPGRNPPALSNPTQVSAWANHVCALDDNGVQCWGGFNTFGQTDVPTLSNPTQVSVGYVHTCALDDSGVQCWGSNDDGQSTVPSLSNPTQVSADLKHTCALDDNGVQCWGGNDEGQTNVPAGLSFNNSSSESNNNSSSESSSSEETEENQVTLSSIYKVATGVNNTCVIDDRGLSCWGDNTGGKSDVPSTLSNPVEVSPGGAMHTCAIDDSGVVCWGLNADGMTSPPAIINPKIITSGWDYSCALDDYGVSCWGRNRSGQTTVPNLSNPTHVDAGFGHACAIDSSGLVCWGDNENGQIDVPSLSNPTGVSAGKNHTCAIENSDVVCWGSDETTWYSNKPVLTNVVSVVAAEQHTCALDDNGVHCWGLDGFGAATVPPLTNPIQVDTRDVHTCALDKNGLTCWGRNNAGQIDVPDNLSFSRTVTISGSTTTSTDDSSSVSSEIPATIPQLTPSIVNRVSAGKEHTCVIHDDGVACWGNNTFGQTNVPPNITNPIQIVTGRYHSCVLDDNGVKCWGITNANYIEDIDVLNPPDLINPRQVSAYAGELNCALDDNGVQCWGDNSYGQLEVPPLDNPQAISVGARSACALDDNGVKCWGRNSSGETDVPSLVNPTEIKSGWAHHCAKDDRGIICWGFNGNNETDAILDSDWPGKLINFDLGSYFGCFIKDSDSNNILNCWGTTADGRIFEPTLVNPTEVSVGDKHMCVIDDASLKCWGDENEFGVNAVPSGLTFTKLITNQVVEAPSSNSSSNPSSSSSNSSSSSSSNSDSSSSESTDSSNSSSNTSSSTNSSASSSSPSGYDSSFFNAPDSSSSEEGVALGNNSSFSQEFEDQNTSFSLGGFGSFGGFGGFSNISSNSIEGVLIVSSPSAAEVFIDQNLNGIKDFIEPSDFSSSSGNFSISGINDQEYKCLKNKPLIATLSSGEEFYSIDPDNVNSSKAITAFSSLLRQWPTRPELSTTGCRDSPMTATNSRGRLKRLDLRLQQGFGVSLNDLLKNPRETGLSSPINEERASAIEEFIRSAEIIENQIFNQFSSEFSQTPGIQHSSVSFLPKENYSIFLSDTYPNPTSKTSPTVTSIDQVSVKMSARFLASLQNAAGSWDSYAQITTSPLISNTGVLIEDKDSCFVGFSSLCKIDPSFFGLFQYPDTAIDWAYHKSSATGGEGVLERAVILDDGSCAQVNGVAIWDDALSSSVTTKNYQYTNVSYDGYFDYDILECERQNNSAGYRELFLLERYPSGASAQFFIQVPYNSINTQTINLLRGLDNFNFESIDSEDVVPSSIPSNFSTRFQELSFSRQMYDSLPWDEPAVDNYSFSQVAWVFFIMIDKNGYSSSLVNYPGGVLCQPANKQDSSSSTADSSGAQQVVDSCFEYLDKNFIWPDSVDDTIFNNPDAFPTLDPYDQ